MPKIGSLTFFSKKAYEIERNYRNFYNKFIEDKDESDNFAEIEASDYRQGKAPDGQRYSYYRGTKRLNTLRKYVQSQICRVDVKKGKRYFQNVYLFITKGESTDLKKLSSEDIKSKQTPNRFVAYRPYDKIELPGGVPDHCAHWKSFADPCFYMGTDYMIPTLKLDKEALTNLSELLEIDKKIF